MSLNNKRLAYLQAMGIKVWRLRSTSTDHQQTIKMAAPVTAPASALAPREPIFYHYQLQLRQDNGMSSLGFLAADRAQSVAVQVKEQRLLAAIAYAMGWQLEDTDGIKQAPWVVLFGSQAAEHYATLFADDVKIIATHSLQTLMQESQKKAELWQQLINWCQA